MALYYFEPLKVFRGKGSDDYLGLILGVFGLMKTLGSVVDSLGEQFFGFNSLEPSIFYHFFSELLS